MDHEHRGEWLSMISRHRLTRAAGDERGAILVVTALVMLTLLVVAAYAIDTAIWFVHSRHLQTQADAAALAAAHDFQCTPGTANAGVDAQIANTIHQYDGTGLSTPPVANPYNPQVAVSPIPATTYSATQHNLFSEVNQASFINQSVPNDTAPSGSAWSGSPCQDDAINVKMSETNVPSFFPFINPGYINREAQVSIENLASGGTNLPLAIPSIAPSTLHATLIDEGNGDAAVGSGRVALSNPSGDGVTWTGTYGNVTLSSSIVGPIGLRVDIGGGTSCGTQLSCYDSNAQNNGIAYARAWSPGPVPGTGSTPAGPEVGDATLIQGSTNACPLTNGVFSNFISSSSNCNVRLRTTVYFATGAACGSSPNVALTLSVNGSSPAMTCSGATTQTPCPGSTNTSCVTTTWTSDDLQLGHDNPDGPVPFSVSWSQSFGNKPSGAQGGHQGACTSSQPCTGSFGTIQRGFDGAYDASTSNSSRSGPIIGASVTDAGGAVFMSHQLDGSPITLSVNVQILNLGVFSDVADSAVATAGSPVTLHTGGSQGTFAIECGGNNGASSFTQFMAIGCPQQFATTTQPNPPVCNTAQTPAVCVNQNPGNGKQIEPGIDCRVNGLISYTNGSFSSCTPSTTCAYPNHWTSPNTVSQILGQSPSDPRLVQVLIVDSSAWVGVTGSNSEAPVRAIATFYITGWSRSGSGGDPCTGATTPTQPGSLPYTSDDDPGDTSDVLLGHFVHYVVPGSVGTGSGPCNLTFGDCIAILSK
jgi:Flp pilus assembly protein TadG